MDRPDFYTYFDGIAAAVSARASCARASFGAVLVDWNTKRILATGYNGAPRGEPHCIDVGCKLEGEGTDAEHCIRSVHAEVNAVFNAARVGVPTEGAVLFLHGDGRQPCERCELVLRQAGVIRSTAHRATSRTKQIARG